VSQASAITEQTVIVTSAAQEHLLTLPEFAPDKDFALKIDIVSAPGEPFSYDLTTEQIGTGTQGRAHAYERSKIPEDLCYEILKSCL
jgi:hypothetical protein